MSWHALLVELTDLADEIAMHYFKAIHTRSETVRIEMKSDASPVTQADQEIEQKIRAIVAQRYPEMVIFGEEFGMGQADAPLKLIIDPIDGTKNFIAGIPFFGSLMAIEEKGVLTAAIVSMPRYKERWWAQKGQGSFNSFDPGTRLQVSKTSELSKATAFHSSFAGEKAHKTPASLLPLLSQTYRQRGYGDFFAHMLVASGAGDFAVDYNLGIWDIAPLKLIVEEAGGTVTDIAGEDRIDTGSIVSSNRILHDQVIRALRIAGSDLP